MGRISSIFSSRYGHLPAGFAAALLLVTTEAVLHIPQNPVIDQEKVGDFRSDVIEADVRRTESETPLDVLVFGSSISNGLDAKSLATSANRAANLVLYSASPMGARRLLEEVILPNQTPQLAVYVLSPRDANALSNLSAVNASIPDLDRYNASRLNYKIRRFLERNLYLFRYRQQLQDIVSLLFQRGHVTASMDETASAGKPIFSSFRASDKVLSEVLRMRQDIEKAGGRWVLAMLPVNPSPTASAPAYNNAANLWFDHLFQGCSQFGMTCIDLRPVLQSAGYFRDTHHLNDIGRRIATQYVQQRL